MKRAITRLESESPGDDAAKTIAEATYRRLRDDLTGWRYAPGVKLPFKELAEAYRVGVSPLREALSRLASERLVLASGQRGFRVPPVSADEMWEIIKLRQLLEREALVDSIAHGDAAWESEIVAAFHRLTRQPAGASAPGDSLSDWDRRHRDFHCALLGACSSQWLLHFIGILYHQSERYRRLRFQRADKSALPRDVDREHREIMDATLARKPRLAGELLVRHLARTGEAAAAALTDPFPVPTPAKRPLNGSKTRVTRAKR